MEPTHAVVDTHDGYTWVKGADGQLFTLKSATEFADTRNDGCKPAHRTYVVRALVPVTSRGPARMHGNTCLTCDETFRADAVALHIVRMHCVRCSGGPKKFCACSEFCGYETCGARGKPLIDILT